MKIGTRGSALALTQTRQIAARLQGQYPEMHLEIVVIKTSGDIQKDVPLAKIGGKGLFIKEIEEALLAGTVDLAVHSMKDLPAELPEGLQIAAVPRREDPRDVLISGICREFDNLPAGARIGTGSLRRSVQLRDWRPDLEIVPLRGNLDTRIRKVAQAALDGVVVAAAGIRRMGWAEKVTQFIPTEKMLPAVGQGVLCLETREEDEDLKAGLAFLEDKRTRREVTAERAFLRRLGGGCTLPVAAFAEQRGDVLTIRGMVGSLNERTMIRQEIYGSVEQAVDLGTELAERLLDGGGRILLEHLEDGQP
ncbi:hydroxymethylbilane synthase [Syntrophus aciditrophicus]|uniref:Porphobilinogen deaminase n=1 Tax=Syntrophus aciditrophicus (strain SB) TaxID=56780 RepID=HEM3_SYNAS|nr:hydroxymethylbilane synthase [Syntrophus aciditrophicus]Q2LQU2.1 RecName: Full=Porphobilinogen deaminase; Short=PBG; AltName: Full=Hydroxymethylbilane synthase; Short=HMBS; AltName: Full=Pre-uroporphyrinogen synthase [Syntrophus aciditrophicus SB]ABC76452.1 porphobilinogen deaminase [Syntrophus aciditrophicus SB]OPY14933.1 MAG: Porphobilinogen deaminase [Syntrophus sp. PtaB.Bin075]